MSEPPNKSTIYQLELGSSELNRRRRSLGIIAVAILLAVALETWYDRPMPLPIVSERVADIAGWSTPSPRNPVGFGYNWLSDDVILACSSDHDGSSGKVFEFHTSTKRVTLRPDLGSIGALSGLAPGCQFTRDKRWLLLHHIYSNGRRAYTSTYEVRPLPTGRGLTVDQHVGYDALWLGDGNRYVEWDGSHKPNKPLSIVVNSLRSDSSGVETRTLTTSALSIGRIYNAATVGNDLIMVGPHLPDELGSVRYIESCRVDIDRGAAVSHPSFIPLPGLCNVTGVAISGDGARVAILLSQPKISGLGWLKAGALGQYPAVNGPQGRITTLWVCNIDGRNMRELGYSRPRAVSDMHAAPEGFSDICDLRWLPSARAVSFVGDDTLYRIQMAW